MPTARFAGDRLLVDDRPVFVRGGEIHYFRLPAETWGQRLDLAVDAGLNVVSSYMPWYHHEPAEGSVDLTGETAPERDLRGFLEAAAERGLYVIARPGPFVNSELRCGGFPEWLFRDHPETMSHRADGRICPGRPIPAEGEPVYRQYVRGWFRQVNVLLAEFDIHNGGPIIVYQPDNELSAAWSFGLLNSLYDPTVLGETWPAWLDRRFGDLDTVNARYHEHYASFADVAPPRAFPTTPGDRRRGRDWLDFKRWFFADWGATMVQWAREDGIRVPMLFNEPVAGFYGHGDHAGFGAEFQARGLVAVTACHTYAPAVLDLDGIQSAVVGIEVVKSSPLGGPPLSVELNTAWHVPRLNHSQLNWPTLLRLGLGRGLQGTVTYPFAAGITRYEDVIDGPEYWPLSPVGLDGETQPGFTALATFDAFTAAWEPEVTASRLVTGVTLAYSPGLRLLDFLGAPPLLADAPVRRGPGGGSFSDEPSLDRSAAGPSHDWLDGYEGVSKQTVPPTAGVWKRLQEAMLLTTRLNLGCDLLELTHPNRAPGHGVLLVPCVGALEREAVDYLLAHLDAGGACCFFPTIPTRDLDGNDDTRLADRLGVRLRDLVRPAGAEPLDYGARVVHYADDRAAALDGWLYLHDYPAGSECLVDYQGQPLVAALPGDRPRAVIAGAGIQYVSHPTLDLWTYVFSEGLGVDPGIVVAGPWRHALLRRADDWAVLTVLDLLGIDGACRLRVPAPYPGCDVLEFPVDLAPHEARCLVLGARVAGDRRLRWAASEIVPLDSDRRRFALHGRVGTTGRLAFDAPVKARLDGADVSTVEREGEHLLEYGHAAEPRYLELPED